MLLFYFYFVLLLFSVFMIYSRIVNYSKEALCTFDAGYSALVVKLSGHLQSRLRTKLAESVAQKGRDRFDQVKVTRRLQRNYERHPNLRSKRVFSSAKISPTNSCWFIPAKKIFEVYVFTRKIKKTDESGSAHTNRDVSNMSHSI